mmetsp:Transcript_51664/g.63236  ORF Transcript_51664/g.63236 Transcript_51664/m.63236 type:complete len:432 (-) Transcript_51664:103-1398(-)
MSVEQEQKRLLSSLTSDVDGKISDIKITDETNTRSHIEIYTPIGLNLVLTTGDDHRLRRLVDDSRTKVGQRMFRVLTTVVGSVGIVFVMILTKPNFHVTKAIAMLLFGTFLSYFVHIFFLIGYSENAYRIYSLNCNVPNWSPMPVTARQLIYKYQPIQSISEFSAIGGGVANQMLVVISSCAWMLMFTQFINDLYIEKIFLQFLNITRCGTMNGHEINNWGCKHNTVNLFVGESTWERLDIPFIFTGVFGLVIIGIFELDPYSKCLQGMHMFGVMLGFGCPIGYTLQALYALKQYGFEKHKINIITAISCDIVALLFWFLWVCIFQKRAEKCGKELQDNPPKGKQEEVEAQAKIRMLSIYNVFTEAITLMAASLAMCLWLWNYYDVHPTYDDTMIPNDPFQTFYAYIYNKYDCNTDVIEPEYANTLLYSCP